MFDAKMLQWANVRQRPVIEAIIKEGSNAKAAKALKMHVRTVERVRQAVREQAQAQGYSPEHGYVHSVPDLFKAKRVSSLYNRKGEITSQWVIGVADEEKRQLAEKAAMEAMAETLPRVQPITAPIHTNERLCNLYTLTDSHVGMMAWHREGGHDWDLKIAEQTLVDSFAQMIGNSPNAKVAVVNQLGDFLHFDSISPVTPTSGHLVDADSRFSKMVAVAIRILRRVIDMALVQHDQVVVLLAEGNHDISSSVWLRHMFKALYEFEPRIHVIDSDLPYYVHQHGKTMLGFHHGHLRKNSDLPLLFASQFPRIWGATEKRYAHVGHRHHVDEKEHSGMTVVQHSTLAARDAYAARGGWFSERQVKALTYHDQFGLVAAHVVTPEMLMEVA